MLKINPTYQPMTVSRLPLSDLKTACRLIVPVQNFEMDLTLVTQRIWNLAESVDAHIQFVGLCNDPTREPSLKRALVTMASMLNYGNVSADTRVLFGKDWVLALKQQLQPGDMIVCWDEPSIGLFQKPLSQIIRSNLNAPIYLISDVKPEDDTHPWKAQAIAWSGFMTIILGFFLLQVRIYQLSNHWTTLLMLLSTASEFWLIWVWNRIFG